MKDIQKNLIPIPKDPVQFIKALKSWRKHKWVLSLAIGKSMSFRYKEIITLAELWPNHRIKDGIHYLYFKPEGLKDFQKIYSLISNWKSVYVFINREYALTDRHAFIWWLQCYIRKIRSKDKNFCYDSPLIYPKSNKIGCHYLNCHYFNWYEKTKETIISTIIETVHKIRFCPALPVENIEKLVNSLEDLSPEKKAGNISFMQINNIH